MMITIPMNISARIESRLGLSTWLTLPITEAQLRTALEDICSFTGDYAVTGYASTFPGLTADMLESEPLSVVNYLAARLDKMDSVLFEKMAALMESDMRPQNAGELIGCIRDEGCFLFLPGVFTDFDLGRYYLYESGLVQMPEVWKEAINLLLFGMTAADLEKGAFTSRGYIAQLSDKKRKKAITAETVPARYRLSEPVGDLIYDDTEGAEQ